MATRSQIHYYNAGELLTSYCHYDGYPEGVGRTLYEHYKQPSKAKELVWLGALSYVREEIYPKTSTHSFDTPEEGVTVAYGRDRGEKGVGASRLKRVFKTKKDLFNHIHKGNHEEYSYIYIVGENQWYVIDHYVSGNGMLVSDVLGITTYVESNPVVKRLITREESVKVARTLRTTHNSVYIVFQDVTGGIKTKIIRTEDFNKYTTVLHITWSSYVLNKKDGRPTQKEFADIIYNYVNGKVQGSLTT